MFCGGDSVQELLQRQLSLFSVAEHSASRDVKRETWSSIPDKDIKFSQKRLECERK